MKNNLGHLFTRELGREVFKILLLFLIWMIANLFFVARDIENGLYASSTAVFWVTNGILFFLISAAMVIHTFFRTKKQLFWLQNIISTLDGYYFIESRDGTLLYISEEYANAFSLEDFRILQDEKNWAVTNTQYNGRIYGYRCKTSFADYFVERREITGAGTKVAGTITVFCEAPDFMDSYALGKRHALTLEQLRVHLDLVNKDVHKNMHCISDCTIRQANTIKKISRFLCDIAVGDLRQMTGMLLSLDEMIKHINSELEAQNNYSHQLNAALAEFTELQNYIDEIISTDKEADKRQPSFPS